VPQGGIISPILSNIYLHEFDVFMKDLQKKYSVPNGKRTTKVSPAYMKISREISKLWEQYKLETEKKPTILTEIKKLRSIRDRMPSRI